MKVPDVIIKQRDLELLEHIDTVQTILNNGLYEMRIFTQVPDWAANDGETGILVTGTNRQLYFHLNSVWTSISFNSIGALVLFDADGDTGITPEFSVDEDILRFYISNVYTFAMGSFGFAMSAGTPVVFDGSDGDTKWSYNSASGYLQATVDGTLVMEI